MIRVVIVDSNVRASELVRGLSKDSCHVVVAQTGREAFSLLAREKIDIAIISERLPGSRGLDILARVRSLYPALDVIMLIDHGAVDVVVKSMKLGAHDCAVRPVNIPELSASVHRAYEKRMALNSVGSDEVSSHQFVGESLAIREVKKLISLAGPSMVPVLVLGETGTGKELVARAIHMASDRSSGPFVAVNMSVLPDNILESELFGYKKGAFTNADSDKAGLLDTANKGTFFADEVGDMALSIQARLLRVAETGTFRRLGDTREKRVNIRLVCATNKDLQKEADAKTFRADLYYRLSTFIIHVPPLRERREDIPLLVDYFLRKICKDREPLAVSSEALHLLMEYPWPGNVRELTHTLERACILSAGEREIEKKTLPLNIANNRFIRTRTKGDGTFTRLEEAQGEHIKQILESADGNKSRAARILGISRTKLYGRLLEK